MGQNTESESAVRDVPSADRVSGVRPPERAARDLGWDDSEAAEATPRPTPVGFEDLTAQTIEVTLIACREIETGNALFQLRTLDGVLLAVFGGEEIDQEPVEALVGEMVEGGNPWPLS